MFVFRYGSNVDRTPCMSPAQSQSNIAFNDGAKDMETASIVSSQFSEVSAASVPANMLSKVTRRGHEVRRSASRHQLNPRPKSLSMSIHTVQFEKGM